MVGWLGGGGGQRVGPEPGTYQSPLGHEKGRARLSVLLAAPRYAARELFHGDDRQNAVRSVELHDLSLLFFAYQSKNKMRTIFSWHIFNELT